MGRACSCSTGIYYQRYTNFTLISLILLSIASTICQFCAAKCNCILLLSNCLARHPKENIFKNKQNKDWQMLRKLASPTLISMPVQTYY